MRYALVLFSTLIVGCVAETVSEESSNDEENTPTHTEVFPTEQPVEAETEELIINEGVCAITIEGTIEDAFTTFLNLCGQTLYRNCTTENTNIHTCTSRRAEAQSIYDSNEVPTVPDTITTDEDVTEPADESFEDNWDDSFIIESDEMTPNESFEDNPDESTTLDNSSELDGEETSTTPISDYFSTPPQTQNNQYAECEDSMFDFSKAEEVFLPVCEEQGFDAVSCNVETNSWSCSMKVDTPETIDEAKTGFPEPEGISWMSSYSVNGVCFIDISMDRQMNDLIVDSGAFGPKSVGELTTIQAAHPSFEERKGGDPIYNDIQCGNGPPINPNERSEGGCPGRVDRGRDGCAEIGPTWRFDLMQATPPESEETTQYIFDALDIGANEIVDIGSDWVELLEEGEIIWVTGLSDNVAAVIEYINLAFTDIATKKIVIVDAERNYVQNTRAYEVANRYANYIQVESEDGIMEYIRSNR